MTYWEVLEEFIRNNEVSIDRKKGSSHPRYSNMIYPVDYGFIRGTKSMDNGGIDIFIGNEEKKSINGIACIADRVKMDSEIKIIYGCNDDEVRSIMIFLNSSNFMKAIYIERKE